MAKERYGIPASLNRSPLDHGIHVNPSLPETPVKQLLFIFLGAMALVWIVRVSFVGSAATWLVVLFVIWGVLVLLYMGRVTKTKDLVISQVPSILAYLPHKARHVITRTTSSPTPFYSVSGGIDGIDEDGTISFYGGAKAVIYRVVGSASYLLFDDDRIEIIDRNDSYWRKADVSSEWLTITTKEPQRIHHQLANLERRNRELVNRDPDLIGLQNESYDILVDHVGTKFSSLHQYMLVRGDSADALLRAQKVFESEAQASTLMLRDIQLQDRTEVVPLLQTFFQGSGGGSVFNSYGYGRTPAERAKSQLQNELARSEMAQPPAS